MTCAPLEQPRQGRKAQEQSVDGGLILGGCSMGAAAAVWAALLCPRTVKARVSWTGRAVASPSFQKDCLFLGLLTMLDLEVSGGNVHFH